jgi:hypothetical protein
MSSIHNLGPFESNSLVEDAATQDHVSHMDISESESASSGQEQIHPPDAPWGNTHAGLSNFLANVYGHDDVTNGSGLLPLNPRGPDLLRTSSCLWTGVDLRRHITPIRRTIYVLI